MAKPTAKSLASLLLLPVVWAGALVSTTQADEPWIRHTIDGSLRGADGVRLGDFNGDGLLDVVTGWEESGVVRLYLNPGPEHVKRLWPRVTVGLGKSPEDAVPFDVDRDGRLEVISCHEGKQRQVLLHWFKGDDVESRKLLNEKDWQTKPIGKLDGQQWMFATPIGFHDGRVGLVVGSKNQKATISLLVESREKGKGINDWPVRKLRDSGWIMSIQVMDMDADGDDDIVFSDRKSSTRCVGWLEQPNGSPESSAWKEHVVGGTDTDPLFIDASPDRILVATRQANYLDMAQGQGGRWVTSSHANPLDVPFGKAIRQLTDDAILFTANTKADASKTDQPGVWLKRTEGGWQAIGSTLECKFDRMELIDLDGDGDLDMMTCEERQNLGVVWYENPGIN